MGVTFTLKLFEILLFEYRSVLPPAQQRTTRSESVKYFLKRFLFKRRSFILKAFFFTVTNCKNLLIKLINARTAVTNSELFTVKL